MKELERSEKVYQERYSQAKVRSVCCFLHYSGQILDYFTFRF